MQVQWQGALSTQPQIPNGIEGQKPRELGPSPSRPPPFPLQESSPEISTSESNTDVDIGESPTSPPSTTDVQRARKRARTATRPSCVQGKVLQYPGDIECTARDIENTPTPRRRKKSINKDTQAKNKPPRHTPPWKILDPITKKTKVWKPEDVKYSHKTHVLRDGTPCRKA